VRARDQRVIENDIHVRIASERQAPSFMFPLVARGNDDERRLQREAGFRFYRRRWITGSGTTGVGRGVAFIQGLDWSDSAYLRHACGS